MVTAGGLQDRYRLRTGKPAKVKHRVETGWRVTVVTKGHFGLMHEHKVGASLEVTAANLWFSLATRRCELAVLLADLH